MQADINTFQSIKVEQAVRNQIQEKLNKWKDYKNGLDATLTAIELGLSGAYSNWRKWGTATSATKRAVANSPITYVGWRHFNRWLLDL